MKVSYSDVGEGGVAVKCEKTQYFLNTLYSEDFSCPNLRLKMVGRVCIIGAGPSGLSVLCWFSNKIKAGKVRFSIMIKACKVRFSNTIKVNRATS